MAVAVSAGAGVHPYFAKQVKKLRKNRKRVLRRDEDAVHQMRVATRRLRSLLSTYGHLYAEVPLSRKRLKWLASVLGEVRDLEVLRMRFAEQLGDERPAWFEALYAKEQRAYEGVALAFGRKRFAELMAAAESMAVSPHFTLAAVQPATEILAPDVEAAQSEFDSALAAIQAAPDPDAARHAARKAAKRSRYTAEAASSALGEPAETIASEAERLQSLFGRCQDDVVAIAYLEAHAPDSPLLQVERLAHEAHLAAVDAALAVQASNRS
jgi:CHAD domain-containing protein